MVNLVRDGLIANLRYYLEVRRNPLYKEWLEKYEGLENPSGRTFRRVGPREGYYFCSFHSHTNNRSLEDVGRIASERGLDLCFIMDHDKDEKFNGDLVKYYNFGKKGIYLIKGVECRCKDPRGRFRKPKRVKMLFALYEGKIEPKQPLVETVKKAKSQGAIVITPSTLLEGDSGGIGEEDLAFLMQDPSTRVDALESLDAGYGFLGIKLNRLYWACVVTEYLADKYGLPVVWSSNDHVNREIGVAGNFIANKDLSCLVNPDEVVRNPNILREQLKSVFKRRAVFPAGFFSPKLGFIDLERLKIILEDSVESLGRKVESFYDSIFRK